MLLLRYSVRARKRKPVKKLSSDTATNQILDDLNAAAERFG